MGGSPSKTRKFTVENDDPTSVIKVSEGVVDRIRGNQLPVRKEVQPSPAVVGPAQAGHFMAVPFCWNEPSLTTIQLRQAHVEDLKKNDNYWENRLKSLETNHKKMNEIMEDEYNKACDDVSNGFVFDPDRKPACQAMKKAVMECYQRFPDEPMNCAKVVQAFQECVDLRRNTVIAGRSY